MSRDPKDTNSSSEQFESRPGIWCHSNRKAIKTKHKIQYIGKQECANTVDQVTTLEDAQCMGRDAGNVARWIILEQYAEAQDRAVHKVDQDKVELDEYTEEDEQIDIVNIDFISSNAKIPGIIAKVHTSIY